MIFGVKNPMESLTHHLALQFRQKISPMDRYVWKKSIAMNKDFLYVMVGHCVEFIRFHFVTESIF